MAPKILTDTQSLDAVHDEVFFSQAATAADPDAAKHSSSFELLLSKQWQPVVDKERVLRQTILSAQAHCNGLDRRLDGWTDRFHNALLICTNNRRDVSDYARYFGNKPPSALKRPVLGIQLQTLTDWVPSIKNASVAQLATLGTELEALVTEGHKAEQALRDAKAKMKDFRTIGARKALFDQVNSLRQATFGSLATLLHEQPKKCLSADWPDSFFRQNRSEHLTPEAEKMALIEDLAALRATEGDKERRLAELLAAEQLEVEQAAKRRLVEAKLQELESRARETNNEARSLCAELHIKPKSRRFKR
ncbi:MAG TPA: hypothetical protein PKE31_21680 [Pseudomonadota bacterium]|nr:hypothetical protein [Pseudomonadota bacterium]